MGFGALIGTRFFFDVVSSRFGPDIRLFRSALGQNQVKIGSESGPGRGFGGGRVQRGRSGWEGSVAPRKVLTVHHLQESHGFVLRARNGGPRT